MVKLMVKLIDPTCPDEIHDNVNKLDLQNGIIGIGNYFTHLPISPPEYQKKHHTSSAISVFESGDEIVFIIIDDYGWKYTLIITGEEMKSPVVQREVKIIKALQEDETNEGES